MNTTLVTGMKKRVSELLQYSKKMQCLSMRHISVLVLVVWIRV